MLLAVALCTVFGQPGFSPAYGQDDKKLTFDDHIQPLLRQRCSSCHSPNKKSGDLDVTSFAALMQGGASGESIEPGDADFSYLFSLVNHDDTPYMPPGNQKIPKKEIDLLAAWINGGALENAGSKAVVKKNKVEMTLAENPTAKPAVVPMPARTVLEPLVNPKRAPNADSLATSPWAPIVALGSQKQVLLYNTQSLDLIGVIPFDGQVNSLRFSRNGQLLLIGGGKAGLNGKVLVWNVVKGEEVTTVGNELDAVLACDISPDQSMVAMGGPQRVVRVYSTETGELLYEMTKHTEWITALEFSPDGALLVTGDRNGGLHTWEAMTGREYLTLKGHTKAITSVSWRIDSNLVASGSEDTTVKLWELNKGTQVKSWAAHGQGVQSIEFARDGRIASCGRDKVAKLWDQNGAQLKAFPAMPDIGMEVSFCDETNRTFAGNYGGQVQSWNFEDGSIAGSLATDIPSIDERVNALQQDLVGKQQTQTGAQAEYDRAKQKLDTVTNELNSLKSTRESLSSQIQQLTQKIGSSNSEATSATQFRDNLQAELTRTNQTIPPLEQSIKSLADALTKSPDDAKLAELLKSLQANIQEFKSKAVTLQNQTNEASAKVAELTRELTESNSQMQQTQSKLAEMDKLIEAKSQEEAPIKTAFDQVSQTLGSANNALNLTNQQLTRWQDELNFKNLLAKLQIDLANVREIETQKQGILSSHQQKLDEIQATVENAKSDLEAVQQQSASIQEQITAAKKSPQ